MSTSNGRGSIKLVVFDWAGTTVDHGCFAPVAPFIESFRACGVEVDAGVVRGPMGLHKRDHIRALLETPAVADAWRSTHGREWDEADVDRLFIEEFTPRQLASVGSESRLVPGLLECVDFLRSRDVRIGTTTGYFREAAELAYEAGRAQGYRPDANFCVSDVPRGRPEPWMIYRNMEALGVYPPSAVVKVGDTVPDMGEGRSAGVWTVGVARTGSDVGLREQEWNALATEEKRARLAAASGKLRDAGAHWVIESVTVLPELWPQIEAQIHDGKRP